MEEPEDEEVCCKKDVSGYNMVVALINLLPCGYPHKIGPVNKSS